MSLIHIVENSKSAKGGLWTVSLTSLSAAGVPAKGDSVVEFPFHRGADAHVRSRETVFALTRPRVACPRPVRTLLSSPDDIVRGLPFLAHRRSGVPSLSLWRAFPNFGLCMLSRGGRWLVRVTCGLVKVAGAPPPGPALEQVPFYSELMGL